MTTVIGVISDTHGLLRPQAAAALEGCDTIVHAGDIGKPEVLEGLRAIAPVTAVRGNVDKWAVSLPDVEVLKIEGTYIYVLHELSVLDLDPEAAGIDVVISGHSHKPLIREQNGVLYLNPGSAGPRRFKLPIALARLTVAGGRVHPAIVELSMEVGV